MEPAKRFPRCSLIICLWTCELTFLPRFPDCSTHLRNHLFLSSIWNVIVKSSSPGVKHTWLWIYPPVTDTLGLTTNNLPEPVWHLTPRLMNSIQEEITPKGLAQRLTSNKCLIHNNSCYYYHHYYLDRPSTIISFEQHPLSRSKINFPGCHPALREWVINTILATGFLCCQ